MGIENLREFLFSQIEKDGLLNTSCCVWNYLSLIRKGTLIVGSFLENVVFIIIIGREKKERRRNMLKN